MSTEKRLKILAIIGSPKGKSGNGYRAIQSIETEMHKLGAVEFAYLFLNKVDLKPCLGCFTCISRGENICPLKDDKEKIELLIEAHDGLIISSPGYVQNVSALMKNFIERFAYTHHRPRYFEKRVLLVANGGAGLHKTMDALSIAIGGPKIVDRLTIISPPWPIKSGIKNKNEKNTRKAAARLYSSLLSKRKLTPTLSDIVVFKFFKATSKECQEWLPADYSYYRNMQGYYFQTNVNPIKDILASGIVKFAGFMMRDMGPNKLEGNFNSERTKGR